MPHTCQKGIKRFITHIMRFSGESRAGSWEGLKMSERTEKGAWLGVLWWLESGARVRIPLNGAVFAWFDLPTSAKEGTSGFPPSLPRCGTEGEVGLESYQKSNMKNGLTLFIAVPKMRAPQLFKAALPFLVGKGSSSWLQVQQQNHP